MLARQALMRPCLLLIATIGIGSDIRAAEPLEAFLTKHCISCHGPENEEGELRIDQLSRNFELGGEAHRWAEMIERVNSGEMPPEGEPQPTQDEIAAFVIKLDSLIKEGRAARMAARPLVAHYRLSRKEFQNTVYDLLGNKAWEQTHGPAFLELHAPHSPYPGSRAAPTLDGDMVYLLGGLGRLTAYRTGNGDPVWSVDVVDDLGGHVPPWGYAESVLIDGDKLICTPGSESKGTFAALDKSTGQVLWRSAGVTARAEYGSPILIVYNNVRQVITMSRSGLIAVSPEDGKLLWQHNRVAKMGTPETTTAHGNSPTYGDGYVFEATSYHTRGGSAVALKTAGRGVNAELAWENDKLNCEHGGYVIVAGFIYMSQGVGWSCLELKTGKERWFGRGPGKGSMIYADGMLYCFSEKGRMGLIEAEPNSFKLVSMFDSPPGDGPSWTHPVISDGKLHLRWNGNLYVYGVQN